MPGNSRHFSADSSCHSRLSYQGQVLFVNGDKGALQVIILLNGKKIGGILTEIIDHVVVVGIGLNLNVRSFPDELRGCASSVFAETKKHLNKKMVFDLLCKELDDCYIMLNTKQDEAILNKWRDYTVLLGQGVTIDIGERSIEGRVINIDRNGRLIVMKTDGEIEHVNAGVCHLKQKQTRDA